MIIIVKKEEEMVMDTNGREMEDGVEKNGGWMVVKDGHKDGNVGRTYSPEQIPDTSY